MADKLDVEKLAREAGFQFDKYGLLVSEDVLDADEMFRSFARLVMEDAAKVCEQEAATWEGDGVPEPMSRLCAMQIRSMKP